MIKKDTHILHRRFFCAPAIAAAVFCWLFVSCASTPISEAASPDTYRVRPLTAEGKDKTVFEFIGYKSNVNLLAVAASASAKESFVLDMLGGSVRDNDFYTSGYEYWRDLRDALPMKHFPYALAESGIASDESKLYFGDYTPQDLAVYQGSHRYVTFVDVLESHISWVDSGRFQKAFASTGGALTLGGLLGGLIVFDNGFNFNDLSVGDKVGLSLSGVSVLLGQLCLIPSLTKPKTAFTVRVKYALCVYDTQQKKLVERKVVDFTQEDEFKGSFESDKTDKSVVYNFYSQCLANQMLQEYENLVASRADGWGL